MERCCHKTNALSISSFTTVLLYISLYSCFNRNVLCHKTNACNLCCFTTGLLYISLHPSLFIFLCKRHLNCRVCLSSSHSTRSLLFLFAPISSNPSHHPSMFHDAPFFSSIEPATVASFHPDNFISGGRLLRISDL